MILNVLVSEKQVQVDQHQFYEDLNKVSDLRRPQVNECSYCYFCSITLETRLI